MSYFEIIHNPWRRAMDEISQLTATVVRKFNNAMNAHDIDEVMALMTDDCVFENTQEPPDGTRYEGATEVRAQLDKFLTGAPKAHFEEEDLLACGDRCVVCWRYTWGDGHVRGVDVLRVRNGKVSEKFAYVKG
jgi:ketosteroid isomerase-like protein